MDSVSDAATPMLCRYSTYITEAPRSAQCVMFSGRCVAGFTSGTSASTGSAASGSGRTQIFVKLSRAGRGISSAG